jgi:hypothetical protein
LRWGGGVLAVVVEVEVCCDGEVRAGSERR